MSHTDSLCSCPYSVSHCRVIALQGFSPKVVIGRTERTPLITDKNRYITVEGRRLPPFGSNHLQAATPSRHPSNSIIRRHERQVQPPSRHHGGHPFHKPTTLRDVGTASDCGGEDVATGQRRVGRGERRRGCSAARNNGRIHSRFVSVKGGARAGLDSDAVPPI